MNIQLTSITSSIEERKPCLFTINRIEQLVVPILALLHHLGIVAHEVTRKHKGRVQARLPDVLFNVGLAVKVGYMGQSSLRCFRHMVKGRENKVRHPGGLGSIGSILALRKFNGGATICPVVCKQEYSVRAL